MAAYLPTRSRFLHLSPPAQGQKDVLTGRERPASGTDLGPHYPAGAAGRGTGWPARGGQHLCSRQWLSLFVSLSSCLLTDFLPADCVVFFFLYLLASQSLLPTSLSCWIVGFSLTPCPRSPRVGGGVATSFQLGTSFHHLVVGSILPSYFSSHLPSLGGKVARGNWPRIRLPPFSNAPSPPSLSLASPSVSSIPPVAPEAIWNLSSPPPSLLSQRRPV